jgi:hypothetical protein
MKPKKLNPYPEIESLRSENVDVINSYCKLYTETTKDYVIYATSLSDVESDQDIVDLLESYQSSRVAIITTRNYPDWISQTYNCKFFKISTAYAYYTTEMPNVPVEFDRTFEKILLSLNNRAQWNRQALYQFALKFNLLDRWYFSYLLHDRFNLNNQRLLYDNINNIIGNTWYNSDLDLDHAYQKLPYKIDNFVDNDWGPGSIDFYGKSFCSFVNETYIDENHNVHFTEKTMKPLAYGHPMLLFSSAGALVELQTLGFETYNSIFDESYDNIESPQLRFETLLRQVLVLCDQSQNTLNAMYEKIKPVLQYNHNYFWNHFHQRYLKDILHIKEEIIDFFKL